MAIDRFTKWIEVKQVTCPKADRVLDFLDKIMNRYGLPHRIITDLGSNFKKITSFGNTVRIGGLMFDTSLSLTRTLTVRWSTPTGWYSTSQRSMHGVNNTKEVKWIKEVPNALRGFVLNLQSQWCSRPTS
jgi:hypothetical protein